MGEYMDLFGFLEMIGGLALFLFGMSLMGTGLEKSAGNKIKGLLERLTSKKLNGFVMGAAVTAIIQSHMIAQYIRRSKYHANYIL